MKTRTVTEAVVDVAARAILPRFRTLHGDEIRHKRHGDLVTVADQEAEAELTSILREYNPGAVVVGEESVFEDPTLLDGLPEAEHAWVIDPVDGTNNFARGSADFGVMVVECRFGEPVRSWIWQPVHELMFVAERGEGVTLNGRPLAQPAERVGPLRTAVPRSLQGRDLPGVDLQRTIGSCAIDYPQILLGSLDAVAYRSQHPWDHLPGALMITEMGGRSALHGGRDYRAGLRGHLLIAAWSPDAWQAVDDALVTPEWLEAHPPLVSA